MRKLAPLGLEFAHGDEVVRILASLVKLGNELIDLVVDFDLSLLGRSSELLLLHGDASCGMIAGVSLPDLRIYLQNVGTLKRERAEADGVIETVEERYARLLWYLEPAYAVADFAWLFLGVVPSAASCVASAFRQAWRKLVAKLSEIIRGATDIVGGKVETRPVDNTSLYPIEAYRVACRRLKKNLDAPIFTFRHECTKEDVEREYRALPSVALYQNLYNKSFAGHTKRMKRGRKRLEDDDEKMAVVQRVADKAGRSFWTIGEFQSLVADEIGTDGASTAKDWVAAWMKTHPGEVTLRNEKRRHSQRRDLKPVLSVGV